jgi:hypothetical protein
MSFRYAGRVPPPPPVSFPVKRSRVKRIIKRVIAAVIVIGCLLYAGDYLSVRLRIPNNREQFGSVEVRRYYAVPLKNRSTEYMFDQPADESCVYSLFPHFGDPPCWYLSRHPRQEIQMGRMPPDPLWGF